jgi:hypothetical protein
MKKAPRIVTIEGIAHPASVLNGEYHGMHLRKNEINRMNENPSKTLVGRPVFTDHNKVEAIGSIIAVSKKTIQTKYGDADSLVVKIRITDETQKGKEAIDGLTNGQLRSLSLTNGYNKYQDHKQGYIDTIKPVEVSLVSEPYRQGCDITSIEENGVTTYYSQKKQFLYKMTDSQVPVSRVVEADDHLEVDPYASAVKRVKTMGVTPEVLEKLVDSYQTVSQEMIAKEQQRINALAEEHKISGDIFKGAAPELIEIMCRASESTKKFEESQKAFQEKQAHDAKEITKLQTIVSTYGERAVHLNTPVQPQISTKVYEVAAVRLVAKNTSSTVYQAKDIDPADLAPRKGEQSSSFID